MLGGSFALGRWAWDPGGLQLAGRGDGQVRDFRVNAGPASSQSGLPLPQMAIAKSTKDPGELCRRAVNALGGMNRFISRGDVVAVKPNIGWDRLPVHAANSNPAVVAAVVKMAFEAGAARVVVTDASCNEAVRCFQRSGIWQASYDVGATVILPADHRFAELRLGGEVLDLWPIYKPVIEADKVINVPIAKHHNLSFYTGALKNWYGLLGGRRNRLHQNIHTSIADLGSFLRPTLTVLDATRVLLRNGPQGGNLDDAAFRHQVIASTDPVAVDTYGCALIGQDPTQVRYLAMAEERSLGTRALETVRTVIA